MNFETKDIDNKNGVSLVDELTTTASKTKDARFCTCFEDAFPLNQDQRLSQATFCGRVFVGCALVERTQIGDHHEQCFVSVQPRPKRNQTLQRLFSVRFILWTHFVDRFRGRNQDQD